MDAIILLALVAVAGAWVYWHHVLKPKKPSLAEKYWYYGLLDKFTPPWLKNKDKEEVASEETTTRSSNTSNTGA